MPNLIALKTEIARRWPMTSLLDMDTRLAIDPEEAAGN
jgi:hypothetical protein